MAWGVGFRIGPIWWRKRLGGSRHRSGFSDDPVLGVLIALVELAFLLVVFAVIIAVVVVVVYPCYGLFLLVEWGVGRARGKADHGTTSNSEGATVWRCTHTHRSRRRATECSTRRLEQGPVVNQSQLDIPADWPHIPADWPR